eukprot:s1370_g5.t1
MLVTPMCSLLNKRVRKLGEIPPCAGATQRLGLAQYSRGTGAGEPFGYPCRGKPSNGTGGAALQSLPVLSGAREVACGASEGLDGCRCDHLDLSSVLREPKTQPTQRVGRTARSKSVWTKRCWLYIITENLMPYAINAHIEANVVDTSMQHYAPGLPTALADRFHEETTGFLSRLSVVKYPLVPSSIFHELNTDEELQVAQDPIVAAWTRSLSNLKVIVFFDPPSEHTSH